MPKGGYRPGAGRKKGFAALESEKARELLVKRLGQDWIPIVEKAIEQALKGDAIARNWLAERGYGKVAQAVVTQDEDGENIPLQTINVVPIESK